ncbi:hypothetical protein Tco_0267314 [Tanacetum coccineum]
MEDLKQHYLDEMLSLSNDLHIKDYRNEKIDIRFRRECENMIDELKGKFNGMSIEINKKKELQRLEQVANLSTYPSQHFKSFCYDDDDDYDYEKSTIPLNEIDSQIPPSIAITPILPTMEPEDSLIMGNEELNTILEKESDEFIKSSVEDLVPIPITPLSNSNEDECLTPSDDVELLLHHDSSTQMISVVSILEGFTNEPPLEENDDLFELKSKNNEWKKILYDDPIDDLIFDPRGDIDEIDAFLDIDILTNIKDDFYDSEGDVLYLESLLSDDTIPNPPPELFLDHDPRSLSDINDLKIMDKVFDFEIHENNFSPTYVSLPFEDHHYLTFTYVIRIFLPYFTYPVNSSLPLSSGSRSSGKTSGNSLTTGISSSLFSSDFFSIT